MRFYRFILTRYEVYGGHRQIVEDVLADGPTTTDKIERKIRIGNLAEFFAASPLREGGIEIVRAKDGCRDSAEEIFEDDGRNDAVT